MENQVIQILKSHNLRITPMRQAILRIFLAADHRALTHADFEHHPTLKKEFKRIDRITIYRTLRTFEEKGLIHQVVDSSDKLKYAYCTEHCTEHHHQDNHVHFYCRQCEQTLCLDDTALPMVSAPSGFQVEEKHMVLSGTCGDCSSSTGFS